MEEEIKRSTFDRLVSGINAEERSLLLSKLTSSKDSRDLTFEVAKDDIKEMRRLTVKYKNESLLYRFFVWIRSVFTKKTVLTLYNEDLVSELARKINRVHPGLIDVRDGIILSLFYEKLRELHSSATFLRPFFSIIDESPGKFYIFLSSFLAPRITEEIMQDADPYNIPFDIEVNASTKLNLIRSMESTLKNIGVESKSLLYSTIKSINWLKQFTDLPFNHFESQFTSIVTQSATCPYINARDDYLLFARVLQASLPIPKEAIRSLYLYPHKNSLITGDEREDTDKELDDFCTKFVSCISVIQMFISTVPIKALGKVIFSSYDWACPPQAGSEDWFRLFKEEWKRVLAVRYTNYLRDKKKYTLTSTLQKSFLLDSFPELPSRPWASLWGGLPFDCEMTGGFLAYFVKNQYKGVIVILNIIVLEGIFINKDNRTKLSEQVNLFVDANQGIATLTTSLTTEGTVGAVFAKLESEKVRTLRGQQTATNLIHNTENTIRKCSKNFCNSTREMEKIFHGILDDDKDALFDTIQNIDTIKGHGGKKFRDNVKDIRAILNVSRAILVDIEPLDTAPTTDL